MKLEGNQGNN